MSGPRDRTSRPPHRRIHRRRSPSARRASCRLSGKAFRDLLANASGAVIHRGLPTGKPRPAESTPLFREGEALFHADPVSLAESDRIALQAVFLESDPFAPGSPPPCGSFHPDFLLVWKKDDAIWSAQLAFGCQEALVIGPGIRFHRYIRPQAYGTLARVLGKLTAE